MSEKTEGGEFLRFDDEAKALLTLVHKLAKEDDSSEITRRHFVDALAMQLLADIEKNGGG